MPPSIPEDVEQITTGWLTDALRAAGAIGEATVTAVDTRAIGSGQGFTGRIEQLSLSYDRPQPGAPASLVAKLHGADAETRELLNRLGMYECEARFHAELAATVPVATPHCYYAAADSASARYLVLLEDLSDRRAGDNVRGCSVADAALAVREIAGFHAAFWDASVVDRLPWLPRYDRRADEVQVAFQDSWDRFLGKFGAQAPPLFRATSERLCGTLVDVARRVTAPPRTVAHGDYRLDNMFFARRADQPPLTVIDWQTMAVGRGVYDVAYFLVFCSRVRRRRAHEPGLLALYHGELESKGVAGYSLEQCRLDYRLTLALLIVRIVTAGSKLDFSSLRGRLLVRVILARIEAALADHDLLALL